MIVANHHDHTFLPTDKETTTLSALIFGAQFSHQRENRSILFENRDNQAGKTKPDCYRKQKLDSRTTQKKTEKI